VRDKGRERKRQRKGESETKEGRERYGIGQIRTGDNEEGKEVKK
jgi:hypothetical protein